MVCRLKRQKDFDLVFKKGKKAYTKNLSLYYIENQKELKIGISVSKKHGNAVTRNRIKRLLRACYIPLLPSINKNCKLIFLPKIKESYDFFTFLEDVRFLLKRENLIDENFK